MTNNPTIDGVSRELLELAVEYLKIHGERSSIEYSTAEDLQTLLDANPRILSGEPVGVLLIDEYFDNREVGDVDVQLDSETCERLAKDLPGQSLQLYIATPEVAALQSRIDQLEAEAMYAAATYQAARARIEELESGFYQQVGDEDLKKISDFIGDGDLPKRSFFCRPDAANLANITMHMVREVQSLRIKLAALSAPVAVAMSFEFEHPSSKEKRTVTLTKRDAFDGMEDYFYDKLAKQICQCESVGETNVVDCNCDEYVQDFEIVSACLDATAALNTSK